MRLLIQHAGPIDNGYPTSTATTTTVAQNATPVLSRSSLMPALYRQRRGGGNGELVVVVRFDLDATSATHPGYNAGMARPTSDRIVWIILAIAAVMVAGLLFGFPLRLVSGILFGVLSGAWRNLASGSPPQSPARSAPCQTASRPSLTYVNSAPHPENAIGTQTFPLPKFRLDSARSCRGV